MVEYEEFINKKLEFLSPSGIEVETDIKDLFPHQKDLVNWALKRGRCAIFADTGLGKSRMQLAWAYTVNKETKGDILILAPLAVASQTVSEGEQIGIKVNYCKDDSDLKPGLNITNYDRLHLFDCSKFVGVVLDESSIIKHHQSKTLTHLLECFKNTPFKLCCTATPSPNDFTELGTHAEFLGIRSRAEMLSEFFINDMKLANKWRLKGHAKHEFWIWVSSWGSLVKNPSDLGYDGSMYELPVLILHQHTIKTTPKEGNIFANEAQTLMERRDARRESVNDRVKMCSDLVNSSDEKWLVWCELNTESESLKNQINESVEVKGADKSEIKEKRLIEFANGTTKVLVSKPKIAGWGMNFQVCHNMAFVGVTDSFEAYYQAVRRCWRFGQTKPVHVHIFSADTEGAVVDNLKRKEKDVKIMSDALIKEVSKTLKSNVKATQKETNKYNAKQSIVLPKF